MKNKARRQAIGRLLIALVGLLYLTTLAPAAVTARYIRVENPTGFAMEFRQIEIISGGKDLVLHHPEMVRGTLPPARENEHPTEQNIIVTGGRGSQDVTNGDTDVAHRASEWLAYTDPINNATHLNPWFEVDLGKPTQVDQIILYASRYPSRFYLDKGHRVVSALGEDRKVIWAGKWQYYEKEKYPRGVFAFEPVTQTVRENPEAGVHIPTDASDWVGMAWLLDADRATPPADAAATPYEVENLFTFSPAHSWGTMMEDLSDIAREHPEMIEQIPATTLARVQLLCAEKYSTAWWRQARETVFNHNAGGLYSWGLVVPHIGELRPG